MNNHDYYLDQKEKGMLKIVRVPLLNVGYYVNTIETRSVKIDEILNAIEESKKIRLVIF